METLTQKPSQFNPEAEVPQGVPQSPEVQNFQNGVNALPRSTEHDPVTNALVDRFTDAQAQKEGAEMANLDARLGKGVHLAVKNALQQMGPTLKEVDPMLQRTERADRVLAYQPTGNTTPKPQTPSRLRPQDLGRQK